MTLTITLTEFLLARIAEDEQRARDLESVTYRPRWTTVGETAEVLSTTLLDDWRGRLLAECEAKRRIVERASRSVVTVSSQRPSPFGNLSFSEGRYYADDGRDVTDEFAAWHAVDGEPKDPTTLRILASVYADHPDYRAEWRP